MDDVCQCLTKTSLMRLNYLMQTFKMPAAPSLQRKPAQQTLLLKTCGRHPLV